MPPPSSAPRPIGRRPVLAALACVAVVAGACTGSTAEEDGGTAAPGATTAPGQASPSCPPGVEPAGGTWSGPVESAVGVDDPEVAGVGDAGLADLGDPATDVDHYDLDLTVDPATGAITEGVAAIELTAVVDLEDVSLDLVGLTVEAVAVGGEPVAARREGARLVVPTELAEGDRTTVTVCYSGTPTPVPTAALMDVPVGWQLATEGVFVLAEPEGARTWFPVDDHPTDKATYAIEVTVPDGWVAVANGVGADVGEVDPGGSTHRWEMAQPMAPYLATVLVGRFERTELPAVGDVPVDLWSVEGAPSDAVEVLSSQSEVLDVLVGLFGPYPFDDLSSALLPGRARGDDLLDRIALETQGLSIFGTGSVSHGTLVHETAHQWFGNAVSLTSWTRDLWWVEGMATYAQWLHAEQLDGRGAYDAEVAAARRTVDRLPGEIGDLEPTDLFGTLAYQGGALVFAALRDEVGEEGLLEVLRTFVERHLHGNATTDDLVAVASEVAGRDLGPFFAAWLGPAEGRPTGPS